MKKLSYLIVLTLILGLVLTGCLLSNVGQVPTSEQSGIVSLTKGSETDPDEFLLYAGQTFPVGKVYVWNDVNDLYVKYVITAPDWCLTETHLHVADELSLIPQTKKGNPIPGKFDYKDEYECVAESYLYTIPLDAEWEPCENLFIAAHAVVEKRDDGVIIQEETAWGDGDDFDGANWATCIVYTVQGETTEEYLEVYIGYEDWPNGDFDYNDFGMYFNAVEYYWGNCTDMNLTKVVMTFTAMVYDSGGDHLIHITRPIVGDSTVTVTRGVSSVGGETPAGTYAVTGNVDVVLFDTAKYGWPAKQIGEMVTVEIVVADPSLNPKGTPSVPRWDLDGFMANYDPWAFNNSDPLPGFYGTEWHIDAWQTVTAVSGGGGRLDSRLVGETLPHVLVVPIAEWIPPYEDTCISGPYPYGPYPYFFNYYNTMGGSHPSWYTEFGYTNVEWGGLSWL